MTLYFIQSFIYLTAAVIAVPIAKRLGLGSVLGYLIAGVVIGPILGFVGQETETIQHFAEFGVVMMLFLVGLELEPKMLWSMRNRLVGLGGLQVGLTAVLFFLGAFLLGLKWQYSLAIGLIFALSSTAIVLQTFHEKGLGKTEGGRTAFSVLLFQDIAVIPMLALIPLLATVEIHSITDGHSDGHSELSLVAHLSGFEHALVIVAAIVAVIVGGIYLSRPLFRFVAASRLREVFTATALMLVIGIAALMSLIGLSPALGAFLAGVVLANSEFRHELESTIEPFKGLLLGLFFITVGAGIRFDLFAEQWSVVLGLTAAVIFLKGLVLYILAIVFRVRGSDQWLFALSLAQAGEFGFVLLNFSLQQQVLPADLTQLLSLVVAISMFLTPGLFILFDKLIVPKYAKSKNDSQADSIDEKGTVIVAGIGRFGQIVNRLLTANGVKTVVLDHEIAQIENLRRINIKTYFGDASKPDLLHTAGIEEAKAIVVAIDDKERTTQIVEYIRHTYPHIKILARAYDRGHRYRLERVGADIVISETYFSALQLGAETLTTLGFHPFHAEQLKMTFLDTESKYHKELYEIWEKIDEDVKFSRQYTQLFVKIDSMLSEAMTRGRDDKHARTERGWTPPPKGYTDNIENPSTVKNPDF